MCTPFSSCQLKASISTIFDWQAAIFEDQLPWTSRRSCFDSPAVRFAPVPRGLIGHASSEGAKPWFQESSISPQPSSARKRYSFLSFPYVCPEPVLAK